MRVNIQKRGDVYQYRIEIASVNDTRKYLTNLDLEQEKKRN